jgi:hypothetical protein
MCAGRLLCDPPIPVQEQAQQIAQVLKRLEQPIIDRG